MGKKKISNLKEATKLIVEHAKEYDVINNIIFDCNVDFEEILMTLHEDGFLQRKSFQFSNCEFWYGIALEEYISVLLIKCNIEGSISTNNCQLELRKCNLDNCVFVGSLHKYSEFTQCTLKDCGFMNVQEGYTWENCIFNACRFVKDMHDVCMYENHFIKCDFEQDVVIIGNCGISERDVIYFPMEDVVKAGCFSGDLEEFEERVNNEYESCIYGAGGNYFIAIQAFKTKRALYIEK